MKLDSAFNEFFDKIQLRALSEERIQSAWSHLHGYLTRAYGLPDAAVFLQGSYANDTAIRPADEDGEYDVDIVCVCAGDRVGPDAALAQLRDVLARDPYAKDQLEPDKPGRPCVRLRYAPEPEGFGFHVDIVPARQLAARLVPVDWPTSQVVWPVERPPLEVPMRGLESWRGTAPLEYTQYCFDKGEHVRRTVRELKRWRDEHEAEIKSIVLQVLIAEHHPGPGLSDADAIAATLQAVDRRLDGNAAPPVIPNPVLPSENLADRWPAKDFREFLVQLRDATDLAVRARASVDEEESHELWVELLGDDFPPYRGRGGEVPPLAPPPGYRKRPQRAPERVEWA
jgi:hypothetical protein